VAADFSEQKIIHFFLCKLCGSVSNIVHMIITVLFTSYCAI